MRERKQAKQKSRERAELKQAFPRSHHRASARGIAIARLQEEGPRA